MNNTLHEFNEGETIMMVHGYPYLSLEHLLSVYFIDVFSIMNHQGPLHGPLFNWFHLTQYINVWVIIIRKVHFMQHIVFLFGPIALREVLDAPHPVILPFMMYESSFNVCVNFIMSARDVSRPFNPFAHQTIHIFVCTKLHFQATLRRLFGESRLAAINASIAPFILPVVYYRHSLDVFVFVLI